MPRFNVVLEETFEEEEVLLFAIVTFNTVGLISNQFESFEAFYLTNLAINWNNSAKKL